MSATYIDIYDKTRKAAFTLAEVLITLGIIAVVAALTLPGIIVNINERRNTEREVNIAQKITQAMEHMKATGTLIQYNNTEDFVNEFKKHIKIAKICDKDHLTECWPSSIVIGSDGKEYDVSKVKQGTDLGITRHTDNVGIVLSDGASLILNYDNTSKGYDVGDKISTSKKILPVGSNKTKEYTYTSNVTDSIDYITDVNGTGKPNRETSSNGKYFDVRSFSKASFASALDCGTAGCIYIFPYEPHPLDCRTTSANYAGNELCGPHPSEFSTDYWAGKKKACKDMGMVLPEISDLQNILRKRDSEYPTLRNISNWFWSATEGTSANTSALITLNGTSYHDGSYKGATSRYNFLCFF